MEALGQTYKWMTRSGLPRPYPGKMNVERYGKKKLQVETERVITASGREEERPVRYTVDNPKSSPLTKKPETPRQKLERLRVEASKKKMKGRVAPMAQPNRVRESTFTQNYTMDARRIFYTCNQFINPCFDHARSSRRRPARYPCASIRRRECRVSSRN